MIEEINKKRTIVIGFLLEIVKDIFQISLISYLAFLLLENFAEGFVSNYINLNILLGVVLVSTVITVIFRGDKAWEIFTTAEKIEVNNRYKVKDWIFIVILGLVGAIMILMRFSSLGWIRWLLALITGVLIVIVVSTLFNQKNIETDN